MPGTPLLLMSAWVVNNMRISVGKTSTLTSSVAVLKAVLPPVLVASTPVVPLASASVVSQARKVKVATPLKPALGTKRILSLPVSVNTTAELFATAPNAVQLLPPSIEYSQVPLVSSTAMTAMPSTAPTSGSVIRSPPALAIISDTRSPLLPTSFSLMLVSAMMPVLSSVGASLPGKLSNTLILTLSVSVSTVAVSGVTFANTDIL